VCIDLWQSHPYAFDVFCGALGAALVFWLVRGLLKMGILLTSTIVYKHLLVRGMAKCSGCKQRAFALQNAKTEDEAKHIMSSIKQVSHTCPFGKPRLFMSMIEKYF
jgi:hypothetical protein